MGQKIHPLGLRLGITQQHRSNWFAKRKNYTRFLLEDKLLRQYLFKHKKYGKAKIVDVFIQRFPTTSDLKTGDPVDVIKVLITSAAPGEIINLVEPRDSIFALKAELEKVCQKERNKANLPELRIRLRVQKVSDRPFTEASVIADFLISELEKRAPFRSALKKAMKQVQPLDKDPVLRGIRIQISGRLNGAEIARTEWTRDGQVPLHTLRANVDYSAKTAKTTYGILGIKVWTYKEEEKQQPQTKKETA